jgi:dipeptidyl aminopeptidase/acylaminoacyl peptidase
MANNIPFQPMGNCVVVTAATANAQGNVVAITAVSPANQYLVFNPDKDDPVFVAYGESTNITATIPDGNSSAVVAIAPYTERCFTGPQVSATKTVYVRIISTHNNAKLFITPGEGF